MNLVFSENICYEVKLIYFVVDNCCATAFSNIMYDDGEDGDSLSSKKLDDCSSTMNSLSRKYPLVILSPYKVSKCNASDRNFAKADSNYQKDVRSILCIFC